MTLSEPSPTPATPSEVLTGTRAAAGDGGGPHTIPGVLRDVRVVLLVVDTDSAAVVHVDDELRQVGAASWPMPMPVAQATAQLRLHDCHGRPLAPQHSPLAQAARGERRDGDVLLVGTARALARVSVVPLPDRRLSLVNLLLVDEAARRDRDRNAWSEAEAAQERLAYVVDFSAHLEVSLDVNEIIERLSRLPLPRLADGCVVALDGDGGAPPLRRVVHRDDDVAVTLQQASMRRALAALPAHADGHAPAVLDTSRLPAELLAAGTRCAIVVPLTVRARRLGTMTLLRAHAGAPDREDLLLARELGRRAANALDNAYRYRERDRLARVLQRNLLPPAPPDLPGAELAMRYVPTGTGAEVGGDFYDAFGTASGWGVVIGDVQGKGPDAAVVTGLARNTIRAAALHASSPAEVLSVLNRALLQEDIDGRFVTAAYLDYRLTDLGPRLVISLGGHPPPLLVRGEDVTAFGQPGTLLGVLEDVVLYERVVELQPGDVVALVTDGVLEAPGKADRFGQQRLAATLNRVRTANADTIADEVVARVLAHTGNRVNDDIAVVVLRVPPP